MSTIRSIAVSLLLALCLILPACDQGTTSTGSATSKGKPRIALIMKSLANEFFATMAKGAEDHHAANAHRYDLIVNGTKDERDLARQVSLIEEMTSQGCDAIVIAPADSKALAPACRRAMEAGVVVINIDNRLDAEVLAEAGISIPFVGPDNRAGAKAVGDVLAKQLIPGAGARVVIIEGVPSAFNSQQRRMGFEDAMKQANIEVVAVQSGQWEMGPANTIAAAMLNEHPDIDAILCCNDNMALGAVAAVKAAGGEGKIKIVGFDNIEAIHGPLREGLVVATADQHADRLAVEGIEHALTILETGQTPSDRETPVDIVTAETLSQAQ
ncbi:MAG: sugar ABC transporter substrate-binding protein [Phycisphaeraceae bacterium]|nr:sugar ABC transporter substrate-binding protein [Phycisphaeraceae bacterium]